MARSRKTVSGKNNGANLGFEAKLWQAADTLRGSMDAAEYKHIADLFPDSFVDSELGEIPKGWEVMPFATRYCPSLSAAR